MMAARTLQTMKKGWSRVPTKGRIGLVIIVVIILLAVGLNQSGVSFTKESYNIIPFDAERAYRDEVYLTNLGPRHSGTEAEYKGAEYIADQMELYGLTNVHIEDYEVFMFEVEHASVSLVEYGTVGLLPRPFNARVTDYEHKVDFVLQGYSGSLNWMNFMDDLEVYDLGNGTDDNAWGQAAGKAGIVKHEPGVSSNTELFFKAGDNGLRALILHNVQYHAELNYLPIFKSTGLPDDESDYPDLPFFMVSKDMGNEALSGGANGSKLRMEISVTRELRTIKVVIGDVEGRVDSKRYVMIGGHHDTVYNGDGAVDNTSGTVTVLEMARNMAKERPRLTIRFATWGGEEEGLFGSGAYWEAHHDDLMENCIYYENLDMPNIDTSRGYNGWIGTNDNGTIEHYQNILEIVQERYPNMAKYNVSVAYSELNFGSDQAWWSHYGKKTCFVGGSGSQEYHTYLDDITHINPESLELFGMVIASHAYFLVEND